MTPASASSLPSVQAEDFEGPLDLLLDEVRRQNVALEKISMAPIVARFLEYMRTATERNLNLDIEWLHMAARGRPNSRVTSRHLGQSWVS